MLVATGYMILLWIAVVNNDLIREAIHNNPTMYAEHFLGSFIYRYIFLFAQYAQLSNQFSFSWYVPSAWVVLTR